MTTAANAARKDWTMENTNENGPKDFGLTTDGWDLEDLAPVADVLRDMAEIKYALENRVRGAHLDITLYAEVSNSLRTADTMIELTELLVHMSEQLREAAEEVTDKYYENMN